MKSPPPAALHRRIRNSSPAGRPGPMGSGEASVCLSPETSDGLVYYFVLTRAIFAPKASTAGDVLRGAATEIQRVVGTGTPQGAGTVRWHRAGTRMPIVAPSQACARRKAQYWRNACSLREANFQRKARHRREA